MQDLSLVYCELIALLSLAAPEGTAGTSVSGTKPKRDKEKERRLDSNVEMERVGDYVVHALEGQVSTLGSLILPWSYVD